MSITGIKTVNPGTNFPTRVSEDTARDQVEEHFEYIKAFAEAQLNSFRSATQQLTQALQVYAFTATPINASQVLGSITSELGNAPEPPEKPEGIDVDTSIDMDDSIDVQAFEGRAPSVAGITVPSVTYSYQNERYDSTLLRALKAKLYADLNNGGTGLSSEVEQGIYDRGRMRLQKEYSQEMEDVEEESAGFCLPTGVLLARRAAVTARYEDRLDALNLDIMKQQAEMAKAHEQYIIDQCAKLEGLLIDEDKAFQVRALEAARETVNAAINAFRMVIDFVNAKANVYQINGSVYGELVNGAIGKYNARLEKAKAVLDAGLRRFGTIAQLYGSEVDGFKGEMDGWRSKIQGQVDLGRLKVDVEKVNADLKLKEAESNLADRARLRDLTITSLNGLSNVFAQLVASALGAIGASASVGFSYSQDSSLRRSLSESITNTLSEGHNYHHTSDV